MKQLKQCLCAFISVVMILSVTAQNPAMAAAVGNKQITSAGAFVMDFDTRTELYTYYAGTRRVPASTTKLAAVYVIYDAIKNGEISLDTVVTISKSTADFSYNRVYSNVPTPVGTKLTIKQLLEFVIVHSACAATIALGEALCGSEKAFVARMNERAKSLGVNASFYDSYGGSAENRLSPRGLAFLSAGLIADHPEVLKIASLPSFTYDNVVYKNTNQLLGEYDGIDGLKTGYTGAAGYCFVGTAVRNGRRIIAVTMGSTTLSSRFPDATTLLDYGFQQAEILLDSEPEPEPEPVPEPPIPDDSPLPIDDSPVDVIPAPGSDIPTGDFPTSDEFAPPIYSQSGETLPSSAAITVDGVTVPVTAYNIDGYHYFKLRDIAFLLSGTQKQFEALWDGDTNIVHLTSQAPYTVVGNELSLAAENTYYPYISTASQIYFDSEECSFIAYNIDDYNYFKLRDIATLIDFGVTWNDETRTVLIDTTIGYFDSFNDADEQYEYPIDEDNEISPDDIGETDDEHEIDAESPNETEAIDDSASEDITDTDVNPEADTSTDANLEADLDSDENIGTEFDPDENSDPKPDSSDDPDLISAA